jgi:hypothetical protein
MDETRPILGSGSIIPEIVAQGGLKPGHQYLVTFGIDTIGEISGYANGLLYVTNELFVYDLTDNATLVYHESPDEYVGDNIVYRDTSNYYTFNVSKTLESDVFDGLQLQIDAGIETAQYDYARSGWVVGNGAVRVIPSVQESAYMPWDYEIVFVGEDSAYVGVISNKSGVRDENGRTVNRSEVLTNQAFDFYVVNRTFIDSVTGGYQLMDMVVQDVNGNGVFDRFEDRILVGAPTQSRWRATLIVIDFQLASESTYPLPGDVYRFTFKRPFFETDSIAFTVSSIDSLDVTSLRDDMKKIKVVPNPYVMTNMMEPAVSNPFLNQRRRLLFTHLPAECTIKIFTVSGVLVDIIEVNNPADNGIVHWDMLSQEGLEIAAGIYIYHVKSKVSGDEKVGKFAVIK